MFEFLAILYRAHSLASANDREVWNLAVEIEEIFRNGFSVSDIREALMHSWCKLRVETTTTESTERTFCPLDIESLFIPPGSCLVLTELGISHYGDLLASAESQGSSCTKPCWSIDDRTLHFEDHVVKTFKCQAVNQETILSAFEAEGWPTRVVDPFKDFTKNILVKKQKVQDGIKGLNRNRKANCLKFAGDGTGIGVRWSLNK